MKVLAGATDVKPWSMVWVVMGIGVASTSTLLAWYLPALDHIGFVAIVGAVTFFICATFAPLVFWVPVSVYWHSDEARRALAGTDMPRCGKVHDDHGGVRS